MTYQRVFYRIEKLPVETRLSIVNEYLDKALSVDFSQRMVDYFGGKHPIDTSAALDKLARSNQPIWRYLCESQDDLVEYEIYARFDDPDIDGNELFMKIRLDEKTGWQIINRYVLTQAH